MRCLLTISFAPESVIGYHGCNADVIRGRGKFDEPGYLETILKDIDDTPKEYWLDMLARYENEKPGDIILPGVPGRAKESSSAIASAESAAPP